MKLFVVAIIYLGFFALIGGAVYYTKSAMPLWALLLMPSFSTRKVSEKDKDESE